MTELTIINPATAQVTATVPAASAADTDAAVARATAAWPAWRRVAPADRAALLRRFAAAVDGHVDELAGLEVREAGHPVRQARWEAGQVRDVLQYYAAAPERLFGRQIPVPGGLDVTFCEPVGVTGVIVPWNFPMPIMSWGLAPALAAGNPVIVKPAGLTPLTALRIGELAAEAGLPEGVLQVLPGAGTVAGRRLVAHPDVRKIVFTGSTEAGREVMAGCAAHIKRLTLELGGKNVNIVFADADIERAAATAPVAAFDNAGQDCCARSRILVQRRVFDRFMALFEPAVRGVRVGDPADENTQMGPLISAEHRARVAAYVPGSANGPSAPEPGRLGAGNRALSSDRPATVAFRGSCPDGPGFWFPPTVLVAASPGDRVCTEEIFGPVATVIPFEDEAEAVRIANATTYGLSGSIWTRDVGRAVRVARAVESGNLSVNSHSSVRYWTPFGGFRQSGLGRELGPDALAAFTEIKNVFIATDAGGIEE
jgi:acyl-CoA reductase-like NAD-dependent aldehyde dehydrogenase